VALRFLKEWHIIGYNVSQRERDSGVAGKVINGSFVPLVLFFSDMTFISKVPIVIDRYGNVVPEIKINSFMKARIVYNGKVRNFEETAKEFEQEGYVIFKNEPKRQIRDITIFSTSDFPIPA